MPDIKRRSFLGLLAMLVPAAKAEASPPATEIMKPVVDAVATNMALAIGELHGVRSVGIVDPVHRYPN